MKREQNKTIHTNVLLTPQENAMVRMIAIQEDRVFSEVIRQCIREAAERRGLNTRMFAPSGLEGGEQ